MVSHDAGGDQFRRALSDVGAYKPTLGSPWHHPEVGVQAEAE
jgi:hypothetical protein